MSFVRNNQVLKGASLNFKALRTTERPKMTSGLISPLQSAPPPPKPFENFQDREVNKYGSCSEKGFEFRPGNRLF
jgi:hypothetical protein